MDGENNGKPYEQMDDLGVFPYFWKPPNMTKVPPSWEFTKAPLPVGTFEDISAGTRGRWDMLYSSLRGIGGG